MTNMSVEEKYPSQVKLIKEKIIPNMIKKGKIGNESSKVTNIEIELVGDHCNLLATVPFAVEVTLVDDEIKEKNVYSLMIYSFIIKIIWQNEQARILTRMNDLYSNELLAYSKYLEKFERNEYRDLFPIFYYGSATNKNSDCIVIENLADLSSYQRYNKSITLPEDHIELVLEKLGMFHGYCYVIKETQADDFAKLVKKIVETRYVKDKIFQPFNDLVTLALNKGLNNLKKSDQINESVYDQLKEQFKDSLCFFKDLVKPTEPLSVICHGDFNKNNILFKYDEDGEVESLKIIDLQTIRYGSPAIDLAFFLFMNVSHEQREKNFEKYFTIYHDAVLASLRENIPKINLEKYDRELFLKDFADHALYGYGIVSFYLPTSINENNDKEFEDINPEEHIDMNGIYNKTLDESIPKSDMKCEEVIECLKEIVENFLDYD